VATHSFAGHDQPAPLATVRCAAALGGLLNYIVRSEWRLGANEFLRATGLPDGACDQWPEARDVWAADHDQDTPFRFACFSRPRQITCLFMPWQKGSVAICLGLIWLSLGQVLSSANDQKARETVDRAARLFISKSTIATMEMQITKQGFQRKISMQFWSLGESNILIRIRRPPEDAGTAILKAGNKILYYLPKANRTVKIRPSMMMSSWMGSNFTLDDLVKQSHLTDDYVITDSFEGQRDGIAVSEYTLTPKPAAVVVWGKITLEVRQADRVPVRQRYYDEDGKLVRGLTFSEYKWVSGKLVPTRLVMQSMDKSGKQAVEETTIKYETIIFDVPISEDIFSPKNLKP
jgi:outer membrane lipoprotein-sorting protein